MKGTPFLFHEIWVKCLTCLTYFSTTIETVISNYYLLSTKCPTTFSTNKTSRYLKWRSHFLKFHKHKNWCKVAHYKYWTLNTIWLSKKLFKKWSKRWYCINNWNAVTWYINPISANTPFLYSLKTLENLWFSNVFRGYRIGKLA